MNTSNITAVLLDWAGTTVDFGSRAPTEVFMEIFRRRGVAVTVEEVRGPMGRGKHEHIAIVAGLPRVSSLWEQQHGSPPTDADVLAMYHDFLPLQKQILEKGSDVISGIPAAISELRRLGIRIGSTTGYTRELMDVVVPIAAAQGYEPEVIICSDEVTAGRPAPWMNLRAAELLNIYPFCSIAIVDDTPVGIEAGKQAGMMTIAVSLTGNALGMSEAEVADLSAVELEQRLSQIEAEFLAVGADYVIPSVVDLPKLMSRMH